MKKQIKSRRHESSFRDNDGFIFYTNGKLLRQVNKVYKGHYDLLMQSGLYEELVKNNLLIPHREVSVENALTKDAYKVIEPQKIEFISYPYEWCFSQLKDAALTTLKLQTIALKHGMFLKDASAFNIQFSQGKPIFIDTLSFETFNSKPWVAYRQFCQHFLNPLVLMSRINPGLNRLLSIYLDGISPELTSKLLPFKSKFNPSIFFHIQLHSKMKNNQEDKKNKEKETPRSFSQRSMLGLIDNLQKTIEGLRLGNMDSLWSNYAPSHESYTQKAFEHKEKIITELFKETKVKKVWDLGSNTGHFSRLVGKLGAEVVSFDFDPESVEKNYILSKDMNNILPQVLDLTNPSPSLGWANQERLSIFERAWADCVMALALIHHLVIGNNIPLEHVAETFAKLSKFLIIEFVPKEDPQVKGLLHLREDIFTSYNKSGFEEVFSKLYKIKKIKTINGSLRILYLMERK